MMYAIVKKSKKHLNINGSNYMVDVAYIYFDNPDDIGNRLNLYEDENKDVYVEFNENGIYKVNRRSSRSIRIYATRMVKNGYEYNKRYKVVKVRDNLYKITREVVKNEP